MGWRKEILFAAILTARLLLTTPSFTNPAHASNTSGHTVSATASESLLMP
jgi:hypothetical protein